MERADLILLLAPSPSYHISVLFRHLYHLSVILCKVLLFDDPHNLLNIRRVRRIAAPADHRDHAARIGEPLHRAVLIPQVISDMQQEHLIVADAILIIFVSAERIDLIYKFSVNVFGRLLGDGLPVPHGVLAPCVIDQIRLHAQQVVSLCQYPVISSEAESIFQARLSDHDPRQDPGLLVQIHRDGGHLVDKVLFACRDAGGLSRLDFR